MPLTINATPGDSAANSYATLAEGDTYAAAHLNGDIWSDEADDLQTQALVQATRLMDQYFEWQGSTATSTQALLWPRAGAYGKNGYLLAEDTIPAAIRDAACEYARQLIASYNAEQDRTLDDDAIGVKKIKAGSVEIERTGLPSVKPVPDAVVMLVGNLGTLKGASSGVVSMRRG